MTATITVGLPVYNGEKTLERSINSILDQSYRNLELIISDNNSCDSTAAICNDFVITDSRVRYIRQPRLLPIYDNFMFVLSHAVAPYFVWQAHDDLRSPCFLENTLAFLEDNPTFIGATAPNCHEGLEARDEKWIRFSPDGTPFDRLQLFLSYRWQSHAIYYALFRRNILLKVMSSLPKQAFFAIDWLVNFRLLLEGPIKRIEDDFLIFGRGGLSQTTGQISPFESTLIDKLFPLNRFAFHAICDLFHATTLNRIEKLRLTHHLWRINLLYNVFFRK